MWCWCGGFILTSRRHAKLGRHLHFAHRHIDVQQRHNRMVLVNTCRVSGSRTPFRRPFDVFTWPVLRFRLCLLNILNFWVNWWSWYHGSILLQVKDGICGIRKEFCLVVSNHGASQWWYDCQPDHDLWNIVWAWAVKGSGKYINWFHALLWFSQLLTMQIVAIIVETWSCCHFHDDYVSFLLSLPSTIQKNKCIFVEQFDSTEP